jgi:hypothetical protein
MKKVLIALFVVAAVICVLNEEPKEKSTYTKDEMREAVYEAEQRAFEEGYAYAEYYFRPDLLEEEAERAYEAGYERGYEEGYDDCLVDHGLDTESNHGSGWIKKDK